VLLKIAFAIPLFVLNGGIVIGANLGNVHLDKTRHIV
jgi:hypothetical protein